MNALPRYAYGVTLGPLMQDVATHYTFLEEQLPGKVQAVAAGGGGQVFLGTDTGLFQLDLDGHPQPVPETPSWAVSRLWAPGNGYLYVASVQDSYQVPLDGMQKPVSFGGADIVDMVIHREPVLVLTSRTLIDRVQGHEVALPGGVVARAVASDNAGQVLVATDHGVFRYDGTRLHALSLESQWTNCKDRLLSEDVRDLCADRRGGFYLATARGLNYHVQGIYLSLNERPALPVRDIYRVVLTSQGTLWVVTARGVACLYRGQWRYYAGKRWLPSDRVRDLCVVPSGPGVEESVLIATGEGLAQITFQPVPGDERLPDHERKAALYQAMTEARHNRNGFVTDCFILDQGRDFLYHASDNDGLWTALYVAAQSFRFAVTQDPGARQQARQGMQALLELVRVTGIPGFPARTFIRAGERVHQSDPGPNWYPSPVEPGILYKNDTSSDEIDGHYFAWFIYDALVADAEEKAQIARVCREVTSHILDHNYTLVGPTGKHTRWGVWTPEKLNNDPAWVEERGLNALEILSHLKVAIHLCGDARFQQEYDNLIAQHGYALNTVLQKRMPPEGECNHSDDELAAVAYYPLLLLEQDPHLRALYLLSLERTWEILRPEGSPFHNVIYGACTGRPCDAERALQWLYEAPLDLRGWTMTNSHRDDVVFQPQEDRFEQPQLTRVLSPRETHVARWNRNPYLPDGGDGGYTEEDGTFWLLPYWMGRYHGIFL